MLPEAMTELGAQALLANATLYLQPGWTSSEIPPVGWRAFMGGPVRRSPTAVDFR